MKTLGYIIFAILYRICCLLKVKNNQVFEIMTHDASETGNIRMFESYMKTRGNYRFFSIVKEERDARDFKGMVRFLTTKPYLMATSSVILMDNAFLPMAYFKVRKGTKVVQLWHGTGTIKKFGQDANEGRIKKLEYKLNQNIDYLIVSSKYLAEQYSRAFGVDPSKVFATGLPRTDAVMDYVMSGQNPRVPDGNKYILYAPTFRDDEVNDPKLHIDLDELLNNLSSDYRILLRLHPYVAKKFNKEYIARYNGRVVNVSDYKNLWELMGKTDLLITDYSSIIFEYILFDKPMYFSADDLDEFTGNGRGFYEDYHSFVPGPFTDDMSKLARIIMADVRIDTAEFEERYFDYNDTHSCERIYNLIMQ